MLLSFMSISGIFGKSNLSKISFTVDLPQEIYAGTPVPFKNYPDKQQKIPACLSYPIDNRYL